MSRVLVVTEKRSAFSGMAQAIEKEGSDIYWAKNGEESLDAVGKQPLDAVIVDESLEDMTGLALIERIVAVNPMINSALVSSLDKKAYHDASEGLGIVMQLPPEPKEADGERLMSKLNKIAGFTS